MWYKPPWKPSQATIKVNIIMQRPSPLWTTTRQKVLQSACLAMTALPSESWALGGWLISWFFISKGHNGAPCLSSKRGFYSIGGFLPPNYTPLRSNMHVFTGITTQAGTEDWKLSATQSLAHWSKCTISSNPGVSTNSFRWDSQQRSMVGMMSMYPIFSSKNSSTACMARHTLVTHSGGSSL